MTVGGGALFNLDDFEETRIEWVPVYGFMDRCRDCGARCAANQGGVRQGHGVFVVCDPCSRLDPHWGGRRDCWDAETLVAEQARRRARYLASLTGEAVAS